MPLIAKRRSEKRDTETAPKNPLLMKRDISEKPVNLCSKSESVAPQKKPLISLRRQPRPTAESAAKSYDGEEVRGDYRGERKESVRTIERGEQGGSEGGEESTPPFLDNLIRKARIAFVRKQTRASSKPAPVPKIDRLWFAIVIQHFPRAVPPLWDQKHRALAKHLTARIGAEAIVSFVTWSVENWTAVLQTELKWMTKSPPPSTPSLPFLVKFVHVFNAAKEKNMDAPLEIAQLVKGLNLAPRTLPRRESNTPPVSQSKPVLPKKDLSANVSTLPILPDWRD